MLIVTHELCQVNSSANTCISFYVVKSSFINSICCAVKYRSTRNIMNINSIDIEYHYWVAVVLVDSLVLRSLSIVSLPLPFPLFFSLLSFPLVVLLVFLLLLVLVVVVLLPFLPSFSPPPSLFPGLVPQPRRFITFHFHFH